MYNANSNTGSQLDVVVRLSALYSICIKVILKLLPVPFSCCNHFFSCYFLYLPALHISPHSTALLCALMSVLSGQHCLHGCTDVDISPLHHSFLLKTGGRKESSTKGAGINHLAFVILIQNGEDGGAGC